jgi:peptide/nickel transport system substrate-binding protein
MLSSHIAFLRRCSDMRKPAGRRRLSAVAGALAVSCAAVALSQVATADAAKVGASASAKPVLTIGISQGPNSLNPAKDSTGFQSIMRALSNESLIHWEPNGTYGPGLATSWHYVGVGNKVFEFTLRHDARFSDGSAVTAKSVKAWLEYFKGADGPFVALMGPIKSIRTIGKWSVEIRLGAGNPSMEYDLSEALNWGAVSSPKAVAKPSLLSSGTYGAGPYVLVPGQTVTGNTYTFVPNKYYYDPAAVDFSKVVVKIITDPTTMLEAIRSGEIEVATGDLSTAAAASSAGVRVVHSSEAWDGLIFLDRNSGPLGNATVRQALNYAVNRAQITKALMGKYSVPTSEPSTIDGGSTYTSYYSYDPAKAKALLASAGYANGFSFTVADQGFGGNSGDPLTQAIAQNLSAIGVTMNITTASTDSQWVSDGLSANYQGFQIPYTGSVSMSVFYSSIFAPAGAFNPYKADDPTLDQLATKAATASPAAASSIWKRMSLEITKQAFTLPVFQAPQIYYVSKKVGGVIATSSGSVPYATEWYPSK